MKLDVLYLDNHLLVIDKPPGLLSQEDDTGDPDVLTLGKAYLKERFDKPGAVFLGLVHRLDRPASGVMALARTSKAASRLTEQFRARTPDKRYLAILEGRLLGEGKCVDFLAKTYPDVKVVRPTHPGAQRAELSWRSIACEGGLTLVEVVLATGRPHQIRVQLSHMGYPILGDFRYGARQKLDGRNLALHCFHLALDHPTRPERLAWKAYPPHSWQGRFSGHIKALMQ